MSLAASAAASAASEGFTSAAVLVAVIAAIGSLVVAIINFISTQKLQTRQISNQAELQRYQEELRRLQAELDEKQAQRNARRDYEYEARKRLYHECSPLIFQIADQTASAYERILGLAEAAAQGNLEIGERSWLTSKIPRYYRLSTEYRILAPLAHFKLLQQKLTRLDLTLDSSILLIYSLMRQANRVLADDFELAKITDPPLFYEPHDKNASTLSSSQPAVYVQQGVPRGILENAVDALLSKGSDGTTVVTSFREFEQQRKDGATPIYAAFHRIAYLLEDFHPSTRPVLWRVLIAMACIYRGVSIAAERAHADLPSFTVQDLMNVPDEDKHQFNRAKCKYGEATDDFTWKAVNAYLEDKLKNALPRMTTSPPQA